jgi:hypothetical protein
MTLTRALAEAELVKRQGARMALVEMAVTISGSNADLQSPLATALRKMGLSASAPVTDGDLAVLGDDQIDEFLDRAELRLMTNIKGNLTLVDISNGPRSEKFGQLGQELREDIQEMRGRIEDEYGTGGTLQGGVLSLDFQQKNDDVEDE